MHRAIVTFVAAAALLTGRPATAQPLGGEGESCQARRDCAEGLRCLANVCTAGTEAAPEPAALPPVAAPPDAPPEAPPEEAPRGDGWADFAFEGIHGFAGLTIGPTLGGDWYFGSQPSWHAGMLLGFRGGVLFDRIELAVELAPATLWWDIHRDPVLSFNLTIGNLIELTENLYWPLRFGLGVTAVHLPHDDTYMQGRVDFVGLIYRYGHVLFEIDLVSARFATEFRDFGLWTAAFNLGASYVF